MTDRRFIKCEVCGSIIMVRTQVGWLPGHPIRIHCAKCGILISGECIQDQENAEFDVRFQNAKRVEAESADIDYYIEVSGELLTAKIRPFNAEEDEYQPPPFFTTLQSMQDDDHVSFLKFKKGVLQLLYFIENDWPFVRRIHELWLSKKHEYLPEQMREYLPADTFPLNNELEYIRGIHQLFLIGFHPVLPQDFYSLKTKLIWENISDVARANSDGLVALTAFFFDNALLDEYENRFLQILNSFIEKYPFFITVIGIDSYKEVPNLLQKGTTTVSFDDVKHFYLDCFEVIGDVIALVVAYNNLKYRNDFAVLPSSSFPTIQTLSDYIEKMNNKGHKVKFCETDEIFNQIISLDTDNGLRNAIGHGSYSYDGVNQIIHYYPSGKQGKGIKEQIYLVEFIRKAWVQLQTIFILIELVYQTRKFYYVQHGIIPISSDIFKQRQKRKIGRNEPCPCGSGKKYKKCCGYT